MTVKPATASNMVVATKEIKKRFILVSPERREDAIRNVGEVEYRAI
ncbi:MAG TPA: hypothetical protein VJN94_07985 [Candidatus Binataceae bacterium]|nr:hypothetical protein [Candidatus Binataceae bacterium]